MARQSQKTWALGLMSGTSLDGIDAALIKSDGDQWVESGAFLTEPYDEEFRSRLRAVLGGKGPVAEVEAELTRRHGEAVRQLLAKADVRPGHVEVIGFHGQTILHEPENGRTWQIGDGALLAALTGIPVVCDFRSHDVAAGGEGAPFAPLYHAALASTLEKPVAVVNIGGVANITWIGQKDPPLAFDSGPGNALLDDWMARHSGQACDRGGAAARAGRVNDNVLAKLLEDPYFFRPPPKSLDRDAFDPSPLEGLDLADGAATLTAFTAATVARGLAQTPAKPKRVLVCGGGRHNPAMMAFLEHYLGTTPEPVEAVGWQGDALEAQAFAYLALRSIDGRPLSLPSTTGVRRATTGGRLFLPDGDDSEPRRATS